MAKLNTKGYPVLQKNSFHFPDFNETPVKTELSDFFVFARSF